jgi:hypothetical protein
MSTAWRALDFRLKAEATGIVQCSWLPALAGRSSCDTESAEYMPLEHDEVVDRDDLAMSSALNARRLESLESLALESRFRRMLAGLRRSLASYSTLIVARIQG